VALLGLTGVLGVMAESLGSGVETTLGLPQRSMMATAAAGTMQWSALVAGLALAAAGVAVVARRRGLLGPRIMTVVLITLVGGDLSLNARAFWNYSDVRDELTAADAITTHLRSLPRPFRVWDAGVYRGSVLMASDIAQLYGHHGNEPHAFDVVNARRGESLTFARAGDPQVLDLFAVNHLIVPAEGAPDSLPGFRRTLTNVPASSGTQATLFERERPIPYARFVRAAAVPASPGQIAVTVVNPQFAIDRLVLLDSAPGIAPGEIPNPLPPVPDVAVTFADWKPGAMRLTLGGGAPSAGYVLVSENWDAEWRATVDGKTARVFRGDGTLITVPVPAGARDVALRYEGSAYRRGRVVTIISLVIVAAGLILPPLVRRRMA